MPKQLQSDGSTADYYTFPKSSRDIGDLIDYKDMNYNIGNIFKACFRLGEKQGTSKEYDLKKILFFAQRELEKVQNHRKTSLWAAEELREALLPDDSIFRGTNDICVG